MKKLALFMAAVALVGVGVGCDQQGGTDNTYDSTTGRNTNNVSPQIQPTDTNAPTPPPVAP